MKVKQATNGRWYKMTTKGPRFITDAEAAKLRKGSKSAKSSKTKTSKKKSTRSKRSR